MANQTARVDDNRRKTLIGVTDDVAAEIRRLLVDPTTGALKCSFSGAITGNLTISGDLTVNGAIAYTTASYGNGLVSAPSIAFTTDPTTGIYHTGTGATGAILAAVNGVQKLALTATDLISSVILTGGTAAGSYLSYKSTTGAGTAAGVAHQWLGGTNGGTVIATMLNNGNVGIGTTTPTARLHLAAGTATANTAPCKFNAGTLLTTPEIGTLEFTDDGTTAHIYGTVRIATIVTRVQII